MKIERNIIISTEKVDRDNEVVKIGGCDISAYLQNPILLFMHRRGDVLGTLINVRKEANRIVADGIKFSESLHPDLAHIPKQFEEGVLKAFSIGFIPKKIIENETTNSEEIIESEIYEVSLVDVGCNPETLAKFYNKEGKEVSLKSLNLQTKNRQEMKEVAKTLGLSESASEMEIVAKIKEIQTKSAKGEDMLAKFKTKFADNKDALKAIEVDIDWAFDFVKKGFEQKSQTDPAQTKSIDPTAPPVNGGVNGIIDAIKSFGGGSYPVKEKTFEEYLKTDMAGLESLKTNNYEKYKSLYEAHYKRPLK